jgi:hypothetical protein
MSASQPDDIPRTPSDGPHHELRRAWQARYGPLVAEQLDPDCRYSLVRVGSVEYAFTRYESYVRALRHTWDGGLVPEPLPSVGAEALLDIAPNLHAVDPDLAGVRRSDVERRSRFT